MKYVLFYCGGGSELYGGWTGGQTWNGWDVIFADKRTVRQLLKDSKTEFSEIQTTTGVEFFLVDSEVTLFADRTGPDGTGLYCLDGFCCQIPGNED